MPSVYSLAAEKFSGTMRTIAIGWITSTLSLGGIITNVLFTQIAQFTSWRGSVWVYVVWAIIGVLALPRFLPKDAALARLPRGMLRSLFGSGLILPFRHRPTRALILSNVARTLHWSAMNTYLALLFSDVYGVNIATIGYLSLGTSVGYLVGVNIASRLTRALRPAAHQCLVQCARLSRARPGDRVARAAADHDRLRDVLPRLHGRGLHDAADAPARRDTGGQGRDGRRQQRHRAGRAASSPRSWAASSSAASATAGSARSSGWSGLLAAYLVWRAVSVNAAREVEMTSGVITIEARPDRPTEIASSVPGK